MPDPKYFYLREVGEMCSSPWTMDQGEHPPDRGWGVQLDLSSLPRHRWSLSCHPRRSSFSDNVPGSSHRMSVDAASARTWSNDSRRDPHDTASRRDSRDWERDRPRDPPLYPRDSRDKGKDRERDREREWERGRDRERDWARGRGRGGRHGKENQVPLRQGR